MEGCLESVLMVKPYALLSAHGVVTAGNGSAISVAMNEEPKPSGGLGAMGSGPPADGGCENESPWWRMADGSTNCTRDDTGGPLYVLRGSLKTKR